MDPRPIPDPAGSPAGPDSALPSVAARVAAFASVLLGGAMGGLIGWALGTLLEYGGLGTGLLLLVGAVTGAGGVAVVAVLTLRALVEWQQVRSRNGNARS